MKLLMISILLAGQCLCYGARPRPAKPAPKPPVVKPVPAVSSMKLVLSPSIRSGPKLYNSWPLVLSVSMWAEPSSAAKTPQTITIKAKTGSWSEALVVEVKGSSGAKWPLHLVKQPGAVLTLDANSSAEVQWWLNPDETQAIPEGDYTISISFDRQAVTGLPAKDLLQSDNYYLQVAKEPSPLTKDPQMEKQYRLAELAMAQGDSAAAMGIVDKLLAADPENIGGFRLKANLLAGGGKSGEAVEAIDKALSIFQQKHPDSCPPAGLIADRDRILSTYKLKKLSETAPPPGNQ